MKRKSMSALGVIITAIILVIVAVVVIFIFRNLILQEADVVRVQISEFGDCDDDGVKNFIDKCPCIEAGQNPSKENDGCPAGTSATKCTDAQEEACKKAEK